MEHSPSLETNSHSASHEIPGQGSLQCSKQLATDPYLKS